MCGQLNYDLQMSRKCKALNNMSDIFGLVNLVEEPTCHNIYGHCLIDVFVTTDTEASLGPTSVILNSPICFVKISRFRTTNLVLKHSGDWKMTLLYSRFSWVTYRQDQTCASARVCVRACVFGGIKPPIYSSVPGNQLVCKTRVTGGQSLTYLNTWRTMTVPTCKCNFYPRMT